MYLIRTVGEIFSGRNIITGDSVAIKVERVDSEKQVLKLEVAVLKKLQGISSSSFLSRWWLYVAILKLLYISELLHPYINPTHHSPHNSNNNHTNVTVMLPHAYVQSLRVIQHQYTTTSYQKRLVRSSWSLSISLWWSHQVVTKEVHLGGAAIGDSNVQ